MRPISSALVVSPLTRLSLGTEPIQELSARVILRCSSSGWALRRSHECGSVVARPPQSSIGNGQ